MTSLYWRSLIATTVIIGLATAPSRFMFPQLILIRGPGLDKPVAIAHTGARPNGQLQDDSLVVLYEGLRADDGAPTRQVHARKSFEVAEFFSPAFWGYYGPDKKLVRQPPFDSATHRSRIYVAAPGGSPLWEDPVVSGSRSRSGFYRLSPEAERILASHGIQLR
jgi:hypothetical protein